MNHEIFEISLLIQKGMKISFYDEYIKSGVKIYEVEDRKKSYHKYLKDLKDIYLHNDFDYIHINMMSYSLFERITYACKYSTAKVIVHCHTAGFKKEKNYTKTKILDKLGRLAVKKYNKKIIRVACGAKAGKFAYGNKDFIIFNNGIDIAKFTFQQSNRSKVRKKLHISASTTVFGLVGLFMDVKNHSFLIDIFNEALKINKDSKLILVGEGPIRLKMEEKVKELNIANNVLFLGNRNDVNEILSAIDIYVMPSKFEGMSIALIEAQVNGLKCYTSSNVDKTSNITGNVEFLSLELSPKEWANIILNSPNQRDDQVIEKVPAEFNSKNSYQKVYDFYLQNMK